MFGPQPPRRHWMKHMAAVPKGFLRYYVLTLLNGKAMSGSEIMSEIEKRTDGHWRPSPGSIYPLLAWLQEKGYSMEVPQQEPGIKRYTLKEQGKIILEEHVKKNKELQNKIDFFASSFIGHKWFNQYPRNCQQIIEAGKKLVKCSWTLLDILRKECSDEAVAKATKILDEAIEKIEKLTNELQRYEEST